MKHRGGGSPSVAPPIVNLGRSQHVSVGRSAGNQDAAIAQFRTDGTVPPGGHSCGRAPAIRLRIKEAGRPERLSRVIDTRSKQGITITQGGKDWMGEYMRASHPGPPAGSRVVHF